MRKPTLYPRARVFGSKSGVVGLVVLAGLLAAGPAQAVNLTVSGPTGEPVTGYRWLIQEDTTRASIPGELAVPGESLAVSFYTSYAPPVAAGCISCAANGSTPPPPDVDPSSVALDPSKRYFIQVLPHAGYAMGGAPIAAGQTDVTVAVNTLPLPTAQISVFVFEDNQPINNAPDLPEERGLAGFTLLVIDAGGRYGISGGLMSQDAYGNPLGTTYLPCPPAEPGCTPTVQTMGTGVITTNANGEALIQNLPAGKLSIQAVPPAGQDWHQTATIEGTKTIDAWVKPNEPAFFAEFGPPGYHVFIGFVKTFKDTSVLNGTTTITGRIVNMHASRPPEVAFFAGEPVPKAWVGLNDLSAGVGRGVFTTPCDPDTGEFSIPNVPPGNYQLVVWDDNLDVIFAFQNVTVASSVGTLDLQDIPVFNWFARVNAMAFYDANENGFRDVGEVGLPGQVVNLRFRDGTIYQSGVTDASGRFDFNEVFPFFNWLVAEIDYTRYKATGATVVVDAGGQVMPDNGWAYPSRGKLTPQEQLCTVVDVGVTPGCAAVGDPILNPNTLNNLSKTETGPVLLEGFQAFLGQTNVMEFGKKAYTGTENGGITGVVQYAITRAENDPRYAVAEPWEPGIPRVQVVLYADGDLDKAIDDLNGNSVIDLADVDNYPFGWSEGGAQGPEDVERNGTPGFQLGDALQIGATDSWDDNVPTGCQGDVFVLRGVPTDCHDGMRNFNQVRPALFDGGFGFGTPAGEPTLPIGTYIVEAVPPKGYVTVKEEDKNVDFGDTWTPPTLDLLPAECVGFPHLLPEFLSLFPDQDVVNPSNFPYDPAKTSPLCDMKQVSVAPGANAAANFFMFTEVPIAANAVGFILDDLSNEFDPNSPNFGEKYAPPWLPVSIRDWTGREVNRVYADEFGNYNALFPSTYSVNVPMPSGVAPAMYTLCMNHPGPIVDTRPGSPTLGQLIEDPFFNRQYSQFCYTFQFMPGTTTYLDTPVVPVAAFAGPGQFPLDCELPSGTPVIYTVSGTEAGGGPWVSLADGTKQLTITSAGQVAVPNPSYDGPGGSQPKTVLRDYGFGAITGQVVVQSGTQVFPLSVGSWSAGLIVVTVPSGTKAGELLITRGDNGRQTVTGVTLSIGGAAPLAVPPGGSIQAVLDAAAPDSLILVPPGTYEELVIMWKPVRLQGWGAASTIINAAKYPAEKLQAWRTKVDALVAANAVTLLPGQTGTTLGLPEPALFNTEEGPGIFVLPKDGRPPTGFGKVADPNVADPGLRPNARIDGFTITGADHGGAIMVNGYAHFLEVANNRIVGNQGFYGGGIRLGHPGLAFDPPGNAAPEYVHARNDNISIHHNQISTNGGLGGVGGGISVCTGSDAYRITLNYICGNFTTGEGGGIGHQGLSRDGRIANNTILFNQSFNQGLTVNGGGILIAGEAPLAPATLTPGSGSVVINANLLQGNLAGAGDGGAIRLQLVNGQDAARTPNSGQWYTVDILNNMVVNNVAGLAGGAISLQDVARSNIVFNTITNNDSTATAGEAFTPGNPNESNPQPAGIVSRAHSVALRNAVASAQPASYRMPYSNPSLVNNIIYHNRSFYFSVAALPDPPYFGLLPPPTAPVYRDLAVLGTPTPRRLSPQYCLLTSTTGYASTNLTGNPLYLAEYFNGATNMIQFPEVTTALQLAPAFDEGGNFIDVRFGPLTRFDPATGLLWGDYHIGAGSAADAKATTTLPGVFADALYDFDGNPRPLSPSPAARPRPDIGADER